MSLTELIDGVEAQRVQLTIYHGDEATRADLAERFADRNLVVAHSGTVGDERDPYAVLTRDGSFVDVVQFDELRSPTGVTAPEFVEETYRPVLDHLDETLFTSFSRSKMIAASREIEDRAWRYGSGELHAGFQTLDIFERQADVYSTLATRSGLDVHAYAALEGSRPDSSGVTVHVASTDEIRNCWFVAYDGNGLADTACLLLAHERHPGSYYGFWSYDPKTVATVLDHLRSEYGTVDSDEGPDVAV